jgi:hypothetical protein
MPPGPLSGAQLNRNTAALSAFFIEQAPRSCRDMLALRVSVGFGSLLSVW